MTSISFTGDIAFSKYFKDSWSDDKLICEELIDFLHSADYTVANVEGAMTDRVMTRGNDTSTLAHASSPEAARWLDRIGSNIWNLSNNHTLDCTGAGLADTIELAKAHGARALGAGIDKSEAAKPIIIEKEGGIGLFSVCYKEKYSAGESKAGIIAWNDTETIAAAIKSIKEKNRWCVIIAHAGEEFSDMPMPHVRRRYLKYLELGADIIVAHHPHVVQNYETVGDKMIFYSLGNFVFDTDYQRLQPHTDSGVLLKLKFFEDRFEWDSKSFLIDRQIKRIVIEDVPIIFREICKKDYKKLAPLAVCRFLERNKVAKGSLSPKVKDFSALQWAKWYIKKKGFAASVLMLCAKLRYSERKLRNIDPALLKYLNE